MSQSPINRFFQARPHVRLVALLVMAFSQPGHSEMLVDLDFSKDKGAWENIDSARSEGRITGALPKGLGENSAWAKVRVEYSAQMEEGLPYVSMKVEKVESGHSQLSVRLPEFGDGSLFRLSLKVRSTAGMGVEYGLRMIEAPWKFYWSERVNPESTWKTFDALFTLDRNKQPAALFMVVTGEGEVNIAKVTLEKVSRDQLIEESRRRNDGKNESNILRSSRFPLGLQSGWMIKAESLKMVPEPEVGPDASVTGVSGFPALHLKSTGPLVIKSEPFAPPMPVGSYTASFYVKGRGAGKLDVVAKRTVLASREFKAASEWQRVEVPFEARIGMNVYALWLRTAGDLHVDAWQINPGGKAAAYAPQGRVEVALKCPATETGEARVQFPEDPAVVDYLVSGNPFPAGKTNENQAAPSFWSRLGAFFDRAPEAAAPRLHAKIVNLYGGEALIKPIPLENKDGNSGTFKFDLFPQSPFGPFRIEAWVADAGGKQISSFQEIVIYRLRRPRHWGKDAPNSPFGTHVEADIPHLQMAKAIGMNWVRLHDTGLEWIGWRFLEPSPGQWRFHDDMLNRYRAQHLKILGLLSTTPDWAGHETKPTPGEKYFDKFFQPRDLKQFANYVRVVVERYKNVIDTYEVWNEPWNAAWFATSYDRSKTGRAGYKSGGHPQAEYAALTKAANEAAKAVWPDVKIVGINTTTTEKNTKPFPDTGGADWSKGMKALNAEQDCDILSYHQYDAAGFNGFPGDLGERGFQVAMGPFLEAGNSKPVWFTEGNSVSRVIGSGFYNHTLPYEELENAMATANLNSRYVLSLLASGCSKVFLYSMGSYDHFDGRVQDWWCSLISQDGYLHPSAAAHSEMAWQLEDTQFQKILPLGEKNFAYVFAGGGRSVAVVAPGPSGAALTLPARPDWVIFDLLGNPVPTPKISGNHLFYIESSQEPRDFAADLLKIFPTTTTTK